MTSKRNVFLNKERSFLLIVKTLDHKMNMCFNLEPMLTLDIFMPLYKESG